MKVFFGVPAYKGVRCVPFFESLEATIDLCHLQNIETVLSVLQGSCYVQTARNELVKAFLETDCDVLFFFDDDVSWHPEDALRLIFSDDDIIAGVFPYKTDEEGYPVVIHTDEDGRPLVRDDGCLYAPYIPFGFVSIKRHVIQKLWDSYPSLKYYKPLGFGLIEFRDLFPQGVQCERWVGEDFAFCNLWNGLEGKIMVMPDITLSHHGMDELGMPKEFKGNYHEYLLRRPGGSEYLENESKIYQGNDIEGWMTYPEQQFLYEISMKYESILEVGSYKGKSSRVLLEGKANKIYCVDNWKPYPDMPNDTAEKAEQRYNEFLDNVKDYLGNGRLKILRQDSVDAAKQFEDKSLDVVFIDGDHSEQGIKSDIESWLPKVKKMICGHDYAYYWPAVKKVVNDFFGDRINTQDSIWYVELDDAIEKREVEGCHL